MSDVVKMQALRNFHRDIVADMKPLDAVAHLLDLMDWLVAPIDCGRAPLNWPGVRLVGMECAVLRRLAMDVNRPVSREHLLRLWYLTRSEAEMPVDGLIDVYICRLRAKLKSTPVSIETWRGHGYALRAPRGVIFPWDQEAA